MKTLEPCTLVIFGATCNVAAVKLLPKSKETGRTM